MDQATELRALVRKAASSPIRGGAVMPRDSRSAVRRIVVFGGKGGVGATTIAVNLSIAFAREGQQCLLCDAAGGDVALQLRLEPRHTLAEAFSGNRGLEEIIVSGPAGVQIVPGGHEAPRWNDAAEHTWNRLLLQMPRLSFGPEVVVIDAGSRPDALARQCWQAADRVLLVSTAETPAIMNAYASTKLLNDPARSASIALLLNRSQSEPAADEAQRRLAHACRRFLGLPLRSVGALMEDENVTQCAARGEPFVLAAPATAASIALRQAARTIINKGKNSTLVAVQPI
jgi:flagellar biosynthesis protein FlhG